jgi:plastocyanin
MGVRSVWPVVAVAILAAGCTPGAQSALSNQLGSNVVLVGESLTKYGQMSSAFGMVAGFNPTLVVVAHGTPIQFHNEDSFDHTASRISASSFPGGNPIPFSAQRQSGTDVAEPNWSSGLLTGGSFSQVLGTSTVGTYLFGCQIHYPSMRGVIIVQ